MLCKAIIFDLDGTLTQSEEGIFNCVRHACKRMNVQEPDAATLRRFIGPPLTYSFKEFMGMTAEEADQAVIYYRERYNVDGLFENRVYDGIRELLDDMKKRGWYLGVATGKPQTPSERIIAHFGLDAYISKVVGPSDSAPDKEHLIRAALPENYDIAYMVGDRKFDIEGGHKAGIKTIGVGYGYGSQEELENAGCDFYAPTVQAMHDFFLSVDAEVNS